MPAAAHPPHHQPHRLAHWRLLLGAALALTALDAAATVVWLQLGMAEGNPLLDQLLGVTSPSTAMALRAAVGATFAAGLYRIGDRSRAAYGGMYLAVAALAFTAGWHGGVGVLHLTGTAPL